jgi:hypothetical protein
MATTVDVDVDVDVVAIGHLPDRAEALKAGSALAPTTVIQLTVNPPGSSRKVTQHFSAADPDRRIRAGLLVAGSGAVGDAEQPLLAWPGW